MAESTVDSFQNLKGEPEHHGTTSGGRVDMNAKGQAMSTFVA